MTVQELINAALRTIGVLASGESPSTEESDDSLLALNQLVSSWSAQELPLYQLVKATVTMTGAASYALATRPIRIKSAGVITAAGLQKDVAIVSAEQWAGIVDKSRTGAFADALWYDGGFPTGTVHLTPKPAAGTLELFTYNALTAFDALGDTVTLPPGYERALIFSLALDLAPQFGRAVDPTVAAVAAEAMGAITRTNARVLGSEQTTAPVEAAA